MDTSSDVTESESSFETFQGKPATQVVLNGKTKENDSGDPQALARIVREERELMVRNTANELESILNNVKGGAKTLLEEVSNYMEATESIGIDYMRCQESQSKEANRLEEVEPDVEGVTHRFLRLK